jgi:hypothetical protein
MTGLEKLDSLITAMPHSHDPGWRPDPQTPDRSCRRCEFEEALNDLLQSVRPTENAIGRARQVIHADETMPTERGVPLGWVDESALALSREVVRLYDATHSPVTTTE